MLMGVTEMDSKPLIEDSVTQFDELLTVDSPFGFAQRAATFRPQGPLSASVIQCNLSKMNVEFQLTWLR